ncbi:hypothetical protein CWC54_00155 [Enterococcus faecium]|nr:hypothetical protein CWC54_00155 [Enterococcus faecium]
MQKNGFYFSIRSRGDYTMARKKRNPDAEKLAESILNTYQPESVEDMQDTLKYVFNFFFKKMLQRKLNSHFLPILKSLRNTITIKMTVKINLLKLKFW